MSESAPQIAPEAAGIVEPLPPREGKRNPLIFDVDAVVDEALAKGPSRQRQAPPTARARAEKVVEDALGPEFGYGEGPPEPDNDVEEPAPARLPKPKPEPEEEPEQAPDQEAAELESDEGTKAKPYKREDLPEDRFIEVKVDGVKTVVPLRELVDGYAGQKAIAQKLAKLGEERLQMTSQVEEARATATKIRDSARELLNDPEQLYGILCNEEFEHVLQAISKKRWEDLSKWQNDPTARAQFLMQRNQRKIEGERERMQQQQQSQLQQQQQAIAQKHQQEVMRPGFDEGVRRAGYPDTNHPEFSTLAQNILHGLLKHHQRELATQEDVAAAVHRACQILQLPAGANKPPPKRPIIAPKAQAEQPRKPNGKFDTMTRQRRSNDADYLMQGLRLRNR